MKSGAPNFRASASNAFNRVELAPPDINLTSPTFGKITQPQGNIQLGRGSEQSHDRKGVVLAGYETVLMKRPAKHTQPLKSAPAHF